MQQLQVKERVNVKRVDHYLNAIKKSVLQGTSRTSIDMSIKDTYTLRRLEHDVIPSATLNKIGKPKLAKINVRFELFVRWKKETEDRLASMKTLPEEDLVILLQELSELEDELKSGDITVVPFSVLVNYLNQGCTSEESALSKKGRELFRQTPINCDLLKVACQVEGWEDGIPGKTKDEELEEGVDKEQTEKETRSYGADEEEAREGGKGQAEQMEGVSIRERLEAPIIMGTLGLNDIHVPFPITYLVYADMTESEQLSNSDLAPATANDLRRRLSKNFQRMLAENQLTPSMQLSLYRIIGPERVVNKPNIEVNNTTNTTQQQMIVVQDMTKLKPKNLIVGENAELLGVGEAYGNMNKSGLLKLAAGEDLDKTLNKLDANFDLSKLSLS